MTVEELIDVLKQFEPRTEVVVDLHSEHTVVRTVELMKGRDNGGYISACYRPEDELRAKDYLYIG